MEKKFSVSISKKIEKLKVEEISSVPGCKSTSFRALIFASQLIGISHLKGVLESEDLKCCIQCLRDLGVRIIRIKPGEYKIFGNGENSFKQPKKKLYFGNAGTLGILMGFLATSSNIKVNISGDKSLQSRSMQKFIGPLSRIGCFFNPKGKKNLPLTIQGTDYGLAQHHICSNSAQEKACILNAALNLVGVTTIEERPPFSRNHSELMLQALGANIKVQKKGRNNFISLRGQQNLKSISMDIAGDSSSAVFFIAICLMIKGSRLIIKRINLNKFRIGYIRCLKSMGANIKFKNVKKKFREPVGDIICKGSKLRPINLPKREVISTLDEIPILMTIASMIPGCSSFNNIEAIRGKETDRIKKMSENLKAFGIRTIVTKNSMKIYGKKPQIFSKKKIKIKRNIVHRIQMCAIIRAICCGQNTTVDGCETIETSFPNFFSFPIMK